MSESDKTLAVEDWIDKNVTIEITNRTSAYDLNDPKFYLSRGKVEIHPQPTISPQKTESCKFSRIKTNFHGAKGVLTYKLERQSSSAKETVAIMFSVPFDDELCKNCLAISIYAGDEECNEALYKEMFLVKKEAKDGGLTFKGSSVDIKATMTTAGESILKVEVLDKSEDD